MKHFRYTILFSIITIVITLPVMAKNNPVHPFEDGKEFTCANEIDRLLLRSLGKKNITPANICSDEVFFRRVYLDVIGAIPDAKQAKKFLLDSKLNKREVLINSLLDDERFADYRSQKWCDILRVKAEFPINLWPNAVQAYYHWIHAAIEANMPYDKFAQELLTSSGSNFRKPQVNFFRAIQGNSPTQIANAVALTFMGVRLEKFPPEKRSEIEAFFSQILYKKTAEWKEEIVYLNPQFYEPMTLKLPDGKMAKIAAGSDPRIAFSDWLTNQQNPYFAKNITNRIWSWIFGRGLIHEADDIRGDNPPVHPQILEFLEKELVSSNYELKHIFRLILNSNTYQQSSIPKSNNANSGELFACYPIRQHGAEVIIDALSKITGSQEKYSSPIPEPFTFIPTEQRSIELADSSITSQFLDIFGRPARDSGLESERDNSPTPPQRRHMINSSHIQKKINRSKKLRALIRRSNNDSELLIKNLYMTILSRQPTQTEIDAIKNHYQDKKTSTQEAAADLVWALINSKEFLFQH